MESEKTNKTKSNAATDLVCYVPFIYADNTLMNGVCFVLMRAIVAYPIWRKMSHRTTHAHDFIPEFEDCLFFFLLFSFYLFHFLFLLFFPEGAFLPHKNTHQEFRILYFMQSGTTFLYLVTFKISDMSIERSGKRGKKG